MSPFDSSFFACKYNHQMSFCLLQSELRYHCIVSQDSVCCLLLQIPCFKFSCMHDGCTPFDSRLQIRCFLQEREYIPCLKILCATSNPFFKISYIHDGCIHLIQACRSVVSCRRESTIFHVQKLCVLPAYNPNFKFICLHEYLCIDLIQACRSYVSCRRLSILHIPKLCALLASNSVACMMDVSKLDSSLQIRVSCRRSVYSISENFVHCF